MWWRSDSDISRQRDKVRQAETLAKIIRTNRDENLKKISAIKYSIQNLRRQIKELRKVRRVVLLSEYSCMIKDLQANESNLVELLRQDTEFKLSEVKAVIALVLEQKELTDLIESVESQGKVLRFPDDS